ncbi:MAG: hypothetical protein JWN30_367, partial [Bacilli bacterium]|nr:hypothetical protein [Bacilli bacterium]
MTTQKLDQALQNNIDWQQFMARHDLVWDDLPDKWEEGAFLGNGLLGAMIFCAEDGRLFWEAGRSDVTEHRNHPVPSFARCRLPVGRFYLETVGKIRSGSIRLDLWNAEATGIVTTDAGEIAWRTYVHAQEKLIVIELEPTEHEQEFTLSFVPAAAVNPRQVHRKEPIDHVNPAPVCEDKDGIKLTSQTLELGGGYTTGYLTEQSVSGKKRLYISIGFSYLKDEHKQEVLDALHDVRHADELLSSHRQWWHQYYPQSFVSIPDTRMESFYWIQMYKLAAATRADRPSMDLMGPWFRGTPW